MMLKVLCEPWVGCRGRARGLGEGRGGVAEAYMSNLSAAFLVCAR